MKMKHILSLAAIAAFGMAQQAPAAVLLFTEFSATAKNNNTKTVSNIDWTTYGLTLASPNLVFGGSATGFISPGGSPNNTVQVAGNVENVGPWNTSFTITPTVGLELEAFTLNYRAINASGVNQTNTKDAIVTLNIYEGADTGGTLLGSFTDNIEDLGNSHPNGASGWTMADIDLSSLAALSIGQAYTFHLTTAKDSTTGGNNWAIDDLKLTGIPEPSAALLGGLGLLALLRRRR